MESKSFYSFLTPTKFLPLSPLLRLRYVRSDIVQAPSLTIWLRGIWWNIKRELTYHARSKVNLCVLIGWRYGLGKYWTNSGHTSYCWICGHSQQWRDETSTPKDTKEDSTDWTIPRYAVFRETWTTATYCAWQTTNGKQSATYTPMGI